MKRHRPWCVVGSDKILARYGSEERAAREVERMRRAIPGADLRVANIPALRLDKAHGDIKKEGE